jgi:hypothetical protein
MVPPFLGGIMYSSIFLIVDTCNYKLNAITRKIRESRLSESERVYWELFKSLQERAIYSI